MRLDTLDDIPGPPSDQQLRAEVLRVAGPDDQPRRPSPRRSPAHNVIEAKTLLKDITRLRDERGAALAKATDADSRARTLTDDLANAQARIAAVEVASAKVEKQNELYRKVWTLVREFVPEGRVRDEFDVIARKSGLAVQ